MADWTETIVAPSATINDALERLNHSARQIVLVVENERLMGTVTDGDIRRALLRRASLDEPVTAIMNRTPRTVRPEEGLPAAQRLMQTRRIRQVPVVDADGCLVGLHDLDDFFVDPRQDAWVVLMAGGLGRRLRPLTEATPKPMIKVGDKPVIDTIVQSLALQGFRRLFLSVNYLAEQIRDHLGDGHEFGTTIQYLWETEPRGTAGALSLLPERPKVPVLVMNADLLTSVHFPNLLRFHQENGAAATMCVREYAIQVPYGVVEFDSARLTNIIEKPSHAFFINAGIYVLSPEVLDLVPTTGRYDMPMLFSHLLAEGRVVAGFPLKEYWMDIGHLEDLEQARTEYNDVFG